MKLFFTFLSLLLLNSCLQLSSDNLIIREPVKVKNELCLLEFYNRGKFDCIVLKDAHHDIKWKFNTGNWRGITSQNDYKISDKWLFFFSKKNEKLIINCLSLITGKINWKSELGENSVPVTSANIVISEEKMAIFHKRSRQVSITGIDMKNGETIYQHDGNFLRSFFLNNEDQLFFPVNDTLWKVLDVGTGNLNNAPDILYEYLGRPYLKKDKQIFYFTESECIMRVDFLNHSLKSIPLAHGTFDLVQSLSYDIFKNYFIYWSKTDAGGAQKIMLQDFQSLEVTEFELPKGYKMIMDLQDISLDEEKSLYKGGDFFAFMMKNEQGRLKLFSVGGDEPELLELILPTTLQECKLLEFNHLYKDDICVFYMFVENSFGEKSNLLICYDFYLNRINSIVQFYKNDHMCYVDPSYFEGVLYGIIDIKDRRFYYDFDVKNATMLRTNIPEADYKIIKL